MNINPTPEFGLRKNVSYRALNLIKKRSEEFSIQNKKIISSFNNIWRIIFLSLLLIILSIFSFFLFLKNPYFNVSNISFLNTEYKYLSIEKLENIMSEYNGHNIFLLDTAKIGQVLQDKFPTISEIFVDKKLPNTLTLNIVESKLKFNVFCSDYLYNLDERGNYVSKIKLNNIIEISHEDKDLMNGDSLISQIELTSEELESTKASISKDSTELLEEKIQEMKLIKYRELLFRAYEKTFESFSIITSDYIDLTRIYSFNCGSYGENLVDYSAFNEFLLSYSALVADQTFFPLELVELKYNRFVVLKNSQYFVFSSLESIEKQIRRYNIVKANLEKDGSTFKWMDLTQEKVIVI